MAAMRIFCPILLCVITALTACDDRTTRNAPDDQAQRIVTLAPALSQMMVDLGAADRLVGIAQHDMAAPAGLPVVGNFSDVDTERLLRVKPTHVLTMSSKAAPPARLQDMADDGHFKLIAYPYPDTIPQVLNLLRHTSRDGAPSLGDVLNMPDAAQQLKDRTRRKLDRLSDMTASQPTPSVLMVIGTSPIMASGPGTVNDQLLKRINARNAAHDASITAPTYGREALLALSPDVIVLLKPDAPALEPDDPRLDELRGLPIPAVENDRIHLINDPLVLLPSTNLPRIGVALARAVHPQLDDELAQLTDAAAARQEPAP